MLTFYITDLDRNPLTRVAQHLGGEVVIPISDSRTARLLLSTYEAAARFVTPLDSMLKVYYYELLVFWGVILTPNWTSDATNHTVEINAHDPSLAWKKQNVRFGDRAVDEGIPFDGRGVWRLAECADPGPGAQAWTPPAKMPGIRWSTALDSTQRWYYTGVSPNKIISPWDPAQHGGVTSPPPPVNKAVPVAGEGVYSKIERGTNIFEAIQNMTGAIIGPEWRLVPKDGLAAPFYCNLETNDRFGIDRSASVVFHRGWGRNNLDSLGWTPDGDKVVNYAVEVWPGGEASRREVGRKALSHSKASWQKYGIYERWQASENKDPVQVLQKRADLQVSYYNTPPDYFTMQPTADAVNDYRYGRDFWEGDTVSAIAREGHFNKTVVGRVRRVTLSADSNGQTVAGLECVPDVPDALTAGDTGE